MNKIEWKSTETMPEIPGLDLVIQVDNNSIKELMVKVEGGQLFKVTPEKYGDGIKIFVPKPKEVTVFKLASAELDALPMVAVRVYGSRDAAIKAQQAFEKLNISDITIEEEKQEIG